MGNAYSELNDPLLQRERFEEQLKERQANRFYLAMAQRTNKSPEVDKMIAGAGRQIEHLQVVLKRGPVVIPPFELTTQCEYRTDIVVVYDPKRRPLRVNAAYTRFAGLSLEQALAIPVKRPFPYCSE